VVKHFLLFLLFITTLYSKSINSAVKDIIGAKEYNSKKKFIEIIFKDKDYFQESGALDYNKILQKLRDEGLLKLKNSSSPLRVAFTTNQTNLQIFLKVIKDTLSSLGFNSIYTIKSIKRGKKFVWVVSLGNNYMLDPLLFSKKLSEKNVFIEDMKRYSLTNWNYVLNTSNAIIVPKKLEYNDIIKLNKTMSAYWINIEDGKKVQIQSSINNNWHPYVVLYNKELKIISSLKKNKKSQKLSLNIPADAVYMKIDDFYTMKNIKDGLSIFIQKRE
jgi:hypothetical protein